MKKTTTGALIDVIQQEHNIKTRGFIDEGNGHKTCVLQADALLEIMREDLEAMAEVIKSGAFTTGNIDNFKLAGTLSTAAGMIKVKK